jgi:tRNA nucleotidyltransferase (CCA-adding enzyme)
MDLITTHSSGDFDAIGSLVAARKLYPEALLVAPGSQERNVREFLSICGPEIKVLTYKDVESEKVSRLIIVETRHRSRLGKLEALVGKKGIEIHIYDHHRRTKNDIKGKVDVFRNVGATVTILVQLIKKRRIQITPLEATIMALGIYEDTGSLTFPSTTKEDVDAVSFLLKKGADLGVVATYLRRELTPEEMDLLATLLRSTQVKNINGVDVALSTAMTEKYVMDLALLTHKLMDIENFNVIFVMAKSDDKVQLVARSRLSFVDAGKAAAVLGGGGHTYAGSATFKGADFQEAKERIYKYLRAHIKPAIRAQDIMTTPIKTVRSSQKVDEVKTIMERFGLEGMAVVDRGKLVGIASLNDLIRAIHHGFGHSRVKGYMTTSLPQISKKTPIYKIQNIIQEVKIAGLPVIDGKKLAGMISRSDLLRCLHRGLIESKKVKKTYEEAKPIDLNSKIRSSLPERIVKLLKFIGKLGDKSGYKVFAVGGFVRDLLLGVKNYDVDIVVEKGAIAFGKIIARKAKGKLVHHKRFGTATIVMPWALKGEKELFKLDLATARTEFYEYPAALPTVKFASIRQDLLRRDFTINAMALHLNRKDFGKLLDFYGGRRDLKDKKIRILHNLSFVEDPTRIFRAVRFEQRLKFKLEEHTQHLIMTAKELEVMERTQRQRLRNELILLLKEPKPVKCILRMDELHELRFIHPKIKLDKKMMGLLESVEKILLWYRASSFKKRAIDKWLVYFMALLSRLSAEEIMALLSRLSAEEIKQVCEKFVFTAGDNKRILSSKLDISRINAILGRRKKLRPSSIYRMLEPLSFEVILFAQAQAKGSILRKRIIDFFTKYNGAKLSITGADLSKKGLRPGPYFREMLTRTLHAKIDGKLKGKKEELDFACRMGKRRAG